MRKRIIGGVVVVGVVASAGVAWAVLGGFLTVPQIAQGFVAGGGTVSCQTTSVNFEVPDPTFDVALGTYAVDSIEFSGVSAACVTLGTAILDVTIVEGGGSTVLATASEGGLGASSGAMVLSAPIPFDDAVNAEYNYLVKNN
jgi:hypothetical protein